MKNKILLKSFLALVLVVTFALSVQVYASEVTGNLSSGVTGASSGSEVGGTLGTGTISGNVGDGSEVSGTLGNGTIAGTVSGGGGSSGGGSNNNGSVLGVSTTGGSSNNGQVLGVTTYTPGFPATGLEVGDIPGTINLIGLILSGLMIYFVVLMMYAYYRTKINA